MRWPRTPWYFVRRPMTSSHLYQLPPAECEVRLERMAGGIRRSEPIKGAFVEALLLAEAATQRLALHALDEGAPAREIVVARRAIDATAFVEWLLGFTLESKPPRIDLLLWDAQGHVHGWFLDDDGGHLMKCSCPEAVLDLGRALALFADGDPEWRDLLVSRAQEMLGLWRMGRDRTSLAERQARSGQSWFGRTFRPIDERTFAFKEGFREDRPLPF
jgi:hypothetical protein